MPTYQEKCTWIWKDLFMDTKWQLLGAKCQYVVRTEQPDIVNMLICCSLQNGTEQMCLISSLEEFWILLHFSFRLCFNSSRPPDIYFSTGLLRSHRTISIRFGSGLDITLIFLLSFIFQQFFLLSCSAWGSFIAALQRGSDSNNLFTCQSGEIKLHKKLHFPQDTYDVCELN